MEASIHARSQPIAGIDYHCVLRQADGMQCSRWDDKDADRNVSQMLRSMHHATFPTNKRRSDHRNGRSSTNWFICLRTALLKGLSETVGLTVRCGTKHALQAYALTPVQTGRNASFACSRPTARRKNLRVRLHQRQSTHLEPTKGVTLLVGRCDDAPYTSQQTHDAEYLGVPAVGVAQQSPQGTAMFSKLAWNSAQRPSVIHSSLHSSRNL